MIGNILLLLMATVIWGYAFVAARLVLDVYDPYWTNALRFLLAGSLSLPYLLYINAFKRQKRILKEGFIASLFLLGILLFQTLGLTHTSVARSGFITTLYAFFVPMISMIFFKKRFKSSFWILVLLSLVGMAFMCNLDFKNLNRGDFFTLLCALSGAGHIMYVGKVAKYVENPIEFNFLQNIFMGVMATSIALLMSGPLSIHLIFEERALEGLLFLGIISSMISFTAQVIAQKKIPDHIAGLIFLMESPFAAFFGYVVLGEKLSSLNLLGAGLIVLAMILIPVLGREVTTLDKHS